MAKVIYGFVARQIKLSDIFKWFKWKGPKTLRQEITIYKTKGRKKEWLQKPKQIKITIREV